MTIRGMGSLFQPWYRDRKTGDRRHSPTWWIAYSFRGTKIRECSHSTKRQDAARLLKKRIGEITQGRIGPQFDRTSFDDLANIRGGSGNSDSVISGSLASPIPPRDGRRKERGDEASEAESWGNLQGTGRVGSGQRGQDAGRISGAVSGPSHADH